jgi:hypothetical protein
MLKMCIQCCVTQSPLNFAEYSRRCISCAKKPTYDELEAKLQVAVEALEFYNQPKKYHGHESSKYGYVAGEIVNDNGDTAKEALEKIKAK